MARVTLSAVELESCEHLEELGDGVAVTAGLALEPGDLVEELEGLFSADGAGGVPGWEHGDGAAELFDLPGFHIC